MYATEERPITRETFETAIRHRMPADKVDLNLIYFPAAPKEIWRTDGPFTSGDSVEVGSDQTYTLKFLPNTAVSDDVAANFRIYSDGKIDKFIDLHDVQKILPLILL